MEENIYLRRLAPANLEVASAALIYQKKYLNGVIAKIIVDDGPWLPILTALNRDIQFADDALQVLTSSDPEAVRLSDRNVLTASLALIRWGSHLEKVNAGTDSDDDHAQSTPDTIRAHIQTADETVKILMGRMSVQEIAI